MTKGAVATPREGAAVERIDLTTCANCGEKIARPIGATPWHHLGAGRRHGIVDCPAQPLSGKR